MVWGGAELTRFVPNFEYHLVALNQLDSDEIAAKSNPMALVMLMDKAKNLEDAARIPEKYSDLIRSVEQIESETIRDTFTKCIDVLLRHANFPGEIRERILSDIGKRRISEMFSSFKNYDYQATLELGRNEGRQEGRLDLCRAQYLRGILTDEAALLTLKLMELSDEEASEYLTIWKMDIPRAGDTTP
jgi:hypothetical protein